MMRVIHHHEERTDPMELTHAESYDDAWREVQRLKADSGDASLVYKIVSSPYGGYVIVALDAGLYTDMVSDELVDGLPPIPPFKRVWSGSSMP